MTISDLQDLTIKTVLSLTWEEVGMMHPHEPYAKPVFANDLTVTEPRLVRPMFGIRVDNQGHITIMYFAEELGEKMPASGFAVYDSEGTFLHRFSTNDQRIDLPAGNIIDYQSDHEGGVYILDFIMDSDSGIKQRLSRIGGNGALIWTKQGKLDQQRTDFNALAGRYECLLSPTSGTVYLPCSGPKIQIAQIDVNDGSIVREFAWEDLTAQPQADASGQIFYGRYEAGEPGRHILIVRDTETAARKVVEPEVQMLTYLATVDRNGNIYARSHDGINVINSNGLTDRTIHIKGIVIRAEDGHIVLATPATNGQTGVGVVEFSTEGAYIGRTDVGPEDTALTNSHLIHADAKHYYFYANETDRAAGDLITYRLDGSLLTTESLNDEKEEHYASFETVNARLLPIESSTLDTFQWQVDINGNTYLTVSDPVGFHVVKIEPKIQSGTF